MLKFYVNHTKFSQCHRIKRHSRQEGETKMVIKNKETKLNIQIIAIRKLKNSKIFHFS